MLPYLGEFLGTMLLILLGDGVVANCSLNQSGMKGAGVLQITMAWAIAVMVCACIFGAASGAHFNPALTIALALAGKFSWAMVPGYCVAQVAGGFVGGILVYLFFRPQFAATPDHGTKLGCFCTRPAIRDLPQNFLCEVIATFVLVFALLGFGNVAGASGSGVSLIFVWGIIASIGMSLGGTTGYAINPARDFGPRLAHAVLSIPNKGSSEFSYGIPVAIFGPVVGGALGALCFIAIPW